MQQYPYISYLTSKQIENFVKSKISEKLGDNRPILFCRWVYAPSIKINFFVEIDTPKKGRHTTLGLATVEDFKCEVFIKGSRQVYTKEWGQYICDTLSDKAIVDGLDFSAITYKKKYNDYWQKIKQQKIAEAETECDEKLFK